MPRPCRPIVVEERSVCNCGGPAPCSDHPNARHWFYDETVDVATGTHPVPGDIFLYPKYLESWRECLAPRYFSENAHRPPVMVVLPNGDWFCVDIKASSDTPDNSHAGWGVSGEFPKITVTPSINCVGRWHGYLTEGVLSDDVDGRIFP